MVYRKKFGNTDIFLPSIGQGTNGLCGCDGTNKAIESIKKGYEQQMLLIDTAENYQDGKSEQSVGIALKDVRQNVFIATKVAPENLGKDKIRTSLENSLKRLQTDYIDLYQIHWANHNVPLLETLSEMLDFIKEGKIRYVGVSNFSLEEIRQTRLILGDYFVAVQSEYNPVNQYVVDYDILAYCQEKNLAFIAYSPFKYRDSYVDNFKPMSLETGFSQRQLVLNWLSTQKNVFVIPKAQNIQHVIENSKANDVYLSDVQLNIIGTSVKRKIETVPVSLIDGGQRKLDIDISFGLHNEINKGYRIKPVVIAHNDYGEEFEYRYLLIEGVARWSSWKKSNTDKHIPAIIL